MAEAGEVDVFCAEASLAAGEPLAGTAAQVSRWLVLEHAVAWGPKGVEDSGLYPDLVHYLTSLTKTFPSLRVQLIRRHEQPAAPRPPRVFLARTDEGPGALQQLHVADLSVLPRMGLSSWLERDVLPDGTQERTEPLYLVCAHGKRDRCCALRGMPLYNALRELSPEQVWQTTHLGGHRFAATMVVLPHGICYGRLSELDAMGLHLAHQTHAFHDLSKVRGRTCYDAVAQAAEVLLRERLNERRLEALKLLGAESSEHVHRVRFAERGDGREHLVELEQVAVPPAPASCGAKPKPTEGLVPLRVRG